MANITTSEAIKAFMQSADQAAMRNAVGLGDVNNTSDAAKPVSTAQATAISAVNSALTSHTGNTSNPHNTTKAQVGLGSVDNTSDAAKPVSTAQAAAINAVQSNLSSLSSVVDGLSGTVETLSGRVDSLETRMGDAEVAIEAASTAVDGKADKANPVFTGTVETENITVSNTATIGNVALTGGLDAQEGQGLIVTAPGGDPASITVSQLFGNVGYALVNGNPLGNLFNSYGKANYALALVTNDLGKIFGFDEGVNAFVSNAAISAPQLAGDGQGITGLSVPQVSGVTPVVDGAYGPIVSITVINGIITGIEVAP